MFENLQKKWKVNGWSLALILTTFALGGSACGFLGKKIMNFTGLDKGLAWFVLYIIILTIIWPLCVLIISIPLGQFHFFKKYIAKIFSRFGGRAKKKTKPARVAIFASGAGSNAGKIIEYFKNNSLINIELIVCNKPGAGVLDIAGRARIETLLIEKTAFENSDIYIKELRSRGISWIILAGFLWKLPPAFIHEWPGRIINIHPALLPGYGGKGMYGKKVHEAVIAAGEPESGISIHFVDELYDHGRLIFQARCAITADDTADSLAQKIHALEHTHFAPVIEQEILKAKSQLK